MESSRGLGDHSSQRRHRRQYAGSDSLLSQPSVRLQRAERLTVHDPSSYNAPRHPATFWSSQVSPPPSAPPALHYSISPYARIPLPPQSSIPGPIHLHHLLQAADNPSPVSAWANPHSNTSIAPALDINLSSSPEAIQAALMMANTELFAAATRPALPSLAITHPMLPWVIVVHRSVSNRVTVLDVLHTLCYELNKGISEQERRGQKRIDLLGGRLRFRGLRRLESGEDVWELVTSE